MAATAGTRADTQPTEDAPRPRSLAALARKAAACTRCPLYRDATQVVVGEGPPRAELMFVGEQPGDREDLEGRPFVGPAGRLLQEAWEATGIDRRTVFVTNAVKHFKHQMRGKRRIHQRPNAGEVRACRWWLDAERRLVKPRLLVALGATAAQALTGNGKGVLARRGSVERAPDDGSPVFLTVHPSSLLRLRDRKERHAETERFHGDLRAIAGHLEELRSG